MAEPKCPSIDPLSSSSIPATEPPAPPPSAAAAAATVAAATSTTGDAAALVLGSWLTAHARGDDGDPAARLQAIDVLSSLLAAGAADTSATTTALLDQALQGEEDPVLRVAALWALGRAPPAALSAAGVIEAVVGGLLLPHPVDETSGEEADEDEGDSISAFQRLFLQQLQLAAAANNNNGTNPTQQTPNASGRLLPPRTGARNRGAGALQAAAVHTLALARSDQLYDSHIQALIAALGTARSDAVVRLAAKVLLALPPARLLPHRGALARAAVTTRRCGGAGMTEEEREQEQAAALLQMMMMVFGGGEGMGEEGGSRSSSKQERPNTAVFDLLYARLDPQLLRALATALLLNHDNRPPSLLLAPFLAVPSLRAQLSLEEVRTLVARIERAAGLVGPPAAALQDGVVAEEWAMDMLQLVLLHSVEAITAHLPTVLALLPLLTTRLPPSDAFGLFTTNEEGSASTPPHPPFFSRLPPEAFRPEHIAGLVSLFLPCPPSYPSSTSSAPCTPARRQRTPARRQRLPSLCLALECRGETDVRARARTLAERILLLPSMRAAWGRMSGECGRLLALVQGALLQGHNDDEAANEEENQGTLDAITTTLLFHAIPGLGLIPAGATTTVGTPHPILAQRQRAMHRQLRCFVAVRALRLLLLGLPPPALAWHLPVLLQACAAVVDSDNLCVHALTPLLNALPSALTSLSPLQLSAHASTLLLALERAAAKEDSSARRFAAILQQHGLGRLQPCAMERLVGEAYKRSLHEAGCACSLLFSPSSLDDGRDRRSSATLAAFSRECGRLLSTLKRCALLIPSAGQQQQQQQQQQKLLRPPLAVLALQWTLGPGKWNHALVLPILQELVTLCSGPAKDAALSLLAPADVDMLVGWATGAPPMAAATAAGAIEEREQGGMGEAVRVAALGVLGSLRAFVVEGGRAERLLLGLMAPQLGQAVADDSSSESKGGDSSSNTHGGHYPPATIRIGVAAALVLPDHTLAQHQARLQPLLEACFASPFDNNEHNLSIHRLGLRLLLRLPPAATTPHVPVLLCQHICDDDDGEEEEGETISALAARLLNRLPTRAKNAAIRTIMQQLLPLRSGLSPAPSSRRRHKHPLEVLALLDRPLVHARAQAFLFGRLLPPASVERQRELCQALARRAVLPGVKGEGADLPPNVLVGMWRLKLVTRVHLDVILEAIEAKDSGDDEDDDDDDDRRIQLRRFLLKLVLSLAGSPLFPTDLLRAWAPKMLAAAVAALHAPGVEAAVSLLHDSDGGLGIRMAHAAQVREDAEMCARLLHELMIKQQRADAPPPGSEARQTLVTAVAQVQARERAAWALLEALMHG